MCALSILVGLIFEPFSYHAPMNYINYAIELLIKKIFVDLDCKNVYIYICKYINIIYYIYIYIYIETNSKAHEHVQWGPKNFQTTKNLKVVSYKLYISFIVSQFHF
jgi:hypothetical protein